MSKRDGAVLTKTALFDAKDASRALLTHQRRKRCRHNECIRGQVSGEGLAAKATKKHQTIPFDCQWNKKERMHGFWNSCSANQ